MSRQLDLGVLFRGQVDPSFISSITQLREAISGLSRGLSTNLTGSLGAVGRQSTSTSVSVDAARRSFRGLADESTNVGKRISLVQDGLQRLVNSFKVVASYGVAGGITYALFGGVRAGTESIFEFDQALTNIAALTGATGGEIAAFGDTMKTVLRTTKFSVKELGEMAVLIAQAGFNAVETMSVMKASADMTMGSLEGMRSAVDLLTTTIRTFGLDATRASEVADVMTSAVNTSKLTIDGLRVAMNYIGPVAAAAGFSVQETAAAMGVLSNNGLRFSTIGTSLRNIISRLIAPNESLRQVMVQSGVNMSVFRKETLTLREVIQELVKIVPNASKAFELFGLRAAPAALALVNAGVEGFDQMVAGVSTVGSAAKAAETAFGGLINLSLNFYNRLKLLAIAIGQGGVADAFRVFYYAASPVVSLLETLANTLVGRVATAFVALTAVVGLAALSFKVLVVVMAAWGGATTIRAVQALTGAIGIWRVALIAVTDVASRLFAVLLAHPLFAVAAAIGLVLSVTYGYIKAQEESVANAQKEAVQAEEKIRQLENLRAQLERTKQGTEDYGSVMKRIIEIAPELRSQIDSVTGGFLDQGKALDELIQKGYVEWMTKLLNVFRDLNSEKRMDRISAGVTAIGAEPYFPQGKEEMNADEAAKFTWTVRQATEALRGYSKTANLTRDEVSTALSKMGYDKLDEFDKIVEGVSKGLDRINESQIKTKDKILKGTGQALPDFFNKFFDTTDIVTRSRLLKTYDSVTKELGRTSKAIDTMSRTVTEGAKEAGGAIEEELGNLEYSNVANQEYTAMKSISDAVKDANRWNIDNTEATYQKRKEIITGYTQFRNQQLDEEKKAELQAAKDDIATYEQNVHDKDRLRKMVESRQQRAEFVVGGITTLQQKGLFDAERSALKELDQEQAVIRERAGKRAEAQHRRQVRMTKEALKEESNLMESQLIKTRLLAEEGKIPSKNVFEAEVAYHQQSADMWKAHAEEVKSRLGDQSDQYRQAMNKALQHTIEGNRLITNSEKKDFEERLIDTDQYSEDWLEINRQMFEKAYLTARQWEAAQRKYFLYYHKYDDEAYRSGKISLTEYFDYLDKMLEDGQMNWRDYWDKVTLTSGSASQVMQLALERLRGRQQTWREVLFTTMTDLPEQFASGFSSAFKEFVSGTKTAGQAWQDFSQNMLYWLGEIAIKWATMKVLASSTGTSAPTSGGGGGFLDTIISGLSSLMGIFGGGGGGSLDFALSRGGGYHGGGIIGEDKPNFVLNYLSSVFDNVQRLHGGGIAGLKSDERPVIMKDGEGAFTENQMKALSPAGGTVGITNIVDPRLIDVYLATPAGRKSVLNIIGAEAFKINRILRTV